MSMVLSVAQISAGGMLPENRPMRVSPADGPSKMLTKSNILSVLNVEKLTVGTVPLGQVAVQRQDTELE
jgi:hypothetical protein